MWLVCRHGRPCRGRFFVPPRPRPPGFLRGCPVFSRALVLSVVPALRVSFGRAGGPAGAPARGAGPESTAPTGKTRRPGRGRGGQGRGRGAKGKEKRGRSRVTMKGGCALVFGFKVAVGAGLRASLFFFFFHDKGLLVRCDFPVSRAFLPPRTLRPSYSLCFPLSCDFMEKNEAPICKWDGYI